MRLLRPSLLAAAASIAALMLPIGAAVAGAFNVAPVRVELSARNRTQALTVRNQGDEPSVVQVQIYAWSQQDGQDVLQPTTDLLLTPPVFTVDPGQAQLLRIALRGSPDPTRQRSYRAVLQEVPGQASSGGPTLQVALRISLPIFVEPPVAASPQLHWQAHVGPDGKLLLSAHNGGNGHIQLVDFKLSSATGAEIASQQQVSYILPGQTRNWTLEPVADLAAVENVRLAGRSDAGDLATEIELTR
jgi:fimbrial chaperone protein